MHRIFKQPGWPTKNFVEAIKLHLCAATRPVTHTSGEGETPTTKNSPSTSIPTAPQAAPADSSVLTDAPEVVASPAVGSTASATLDVGNGSLAGQLFSRFQSRGGKLPAKEMLSLAAPLLVGMLIDVVDVLSFGPQGFATGILVGAPLAWWCASMWGLPRSVRLLAAAAAALYCFVPGTEILPLATFAQVVARIAGAQRTAA